MTLEEILNIAPIVPVLVIERVEDAVPLGRALVAGGLRALEVTLRTPAALQAISAIAQDVEGAVVGAGTVLGPRDLEAAARAGARFAVSPGLTPALAEPGPCPLLPGAATASEVMSALEAGFQLLKFFPAVPAGGVDALKALGGPLPHVRFCPTGGIGPENAPAFLKLANVVCVGGSWVAPKAMIERGDWDGIERLARTAAALPRA